MLALGDPGMPLQTLTIAVPDQILARIRDWAGRANRSVEAEALDVLADAVSDDELLPGLQAELDNLRSLDETGLRRASESRLPPEMSAELKSLHFKQGREGLTPADERRRRYLMRQYNRVVLIRAVAFAELRQRGLEIPDLNAARSR